MKSWPVRLSLPALLLAAGLMSGLAAQTATITTADPVTFIKGAGRVTRPVQPDEVFSIVAVHGDQVTIADVDGYKTSPKRGALKITDLSPPPSAPATNTAPAATTVTHAAPAAAP